MANQLEARAADLAETVVTPSGLAVVVQARQRQHPKALAKRRSSPWTTRENIDRTLEGIREQDYGPSQVIVQVDQGMAFSPGERRRLESQAVIQEIDPGTNHAAALNQGIDKLAEVTGEDGMPPITVFTEAGARFATRQAFLSAAYHIGTGAVGVFGTRLADERASRGESLLYTASALTNVRLRDVDYGPDTGAGFMAADRGAFATAALVEHPFDERYRRGGADGAWGKERMAAGDLVVYDPAMTVQYAEHLNPIELAAQLLEWRDYAHPN